MIFLKTFTPLEKIQLLQRSILVNSFCYYELDSNLLSDYQYDFDALQLAELKRDYPEDFRNSRYYEYFHDFCSEDSNQHATSGFALLRMIEKKDPELYRHIWMDALMALKSKSERQG